MIHLSVGCWRVTAFPLRHDIWPRVSAPKVLAASAQVTPRVLFQHTKHVMIPVPDIHYTRTDKGAHRHPDTGLQTHIHTLNIAGIPHVGETCEIPHEA